MSGRISYQFNANIFLKMYKFLGNRTFVDCSTWYPVVVVSFTIQWDEKNIEGVVL